MDERTTKRLELLAEEIIEALSLVLQRRKPLDVSTLSETLKTRPHLMNLLLDSQRRMAETKASRKPLASPAPEAGGAPRPDKPRTGPGKEIIRKYKQALKDLSDSEFNAREIEESFTELATILATFAETCNGPGLKPELTVLKETLRHKAMPSRLTAISKNLKEIFYKMDTEAFVRTFGEEDAGLGKGGPEGLEDNVRDMLAALVREIASFEEQELVSLAEDLGLRIQREFTFENFEPYIEEIKDLIFRLKDFIRRERHELFLFAQEIMVHLEETEKDLLKTIDANKEHLEGLESDFATRVVEDMSAIERTIHDDNLSLEEIRPKVLERIGSIRKRFHRLRAEDMERIKMAETEKGAIRRRLRSVHQRYQEFAAKSRDQLAEMEEFKKASLHDGLTGAYNRRAYDLQIRKALEELKKGGITKFALIIFDVDNFKNFNNAYGHRAGDKILLHVARLSRDAVRAGDFVARYGGDEFALILPEADLATGAKVADKIRGDISGIEFKIYRDQDITVQVTLSMGVAAAQREDTTSTVFTRADKALYLAKENGRNQVRTEKELAA